MRHNKFTAIIAAGILVINTLGFSTSVFAQGNSISNNLVPFNYSFEKVTKSIGKWSSQNMPKETSEYKYEVYIPAKVQQGKNKVSNKAEINLDEQEAYTGNNSVRIEVANGEIGRCGLTAPQAKVEGGKTYTIGAKFKTKNVTQARIKIVPCYTEKGVIIPSNSREHGYSKSLTGDNKWTDVSKTWKLPKQVKTKKGNVLKDVTHVKVQAFLETGEGTVWIDDVYVKEYKPVDNLLISKTDIKVMQGKTKMLNITVLPIEATNKDIKLESLDENIATVDNGAIKGVGIGTTQIITSSIDNPQKKVTCNVEVTINPATIKHVNKVKFENTQPQVEVGRYSKLEYKITPNDATIQGVELESLNPDIAVVKDEYIKGVKQGTAKIKIKTVDGQKEDITTVNVVPYKEDEYDILREKWVNSLIGKGYDVKNPEIRDMIKDLEKSSTKFWNDMNKDKSRTELWNDLNKMDSNPIHIYKSYCRLRDMAKLYVMEGSSLKGNKKFLNDIVDGLDWIYKTHYREGAKEYGNWWHWEIGAPLALNDAVLVLYNELTPEQINNYMNVINYFQPDPRYSGKTPYHIKGKGLRESVGANRMDTCKVSILRGIIEKDESKIKAGVKAISPVTAYVKDRDGFYKDGSFIQHGSVPYTGTYGNVLIDGMASILNLLSGTKWEIKDPNTQNIYIIVEESFMPLLYNGEMMDMVNGRAVSRGGGANDHGVGHQTLNSIINLIPGAPQQYKQKYKSFAKYMIEKDKFYNHMENIDDIPSYELTRAILKDNTIPKFNEKLFHKRFSNMDRVVHKGNGYTFAISMHSNRVGNYESMLGENLKGWHTGDGMNYIYNNDLEHYMEFWPTVDPYRLPGTTEDTRTRKDGKGQRRNKDRNLLSPKSWVGGSDISGLYGVVGMDFYSWDDSLEAKKSWFMFDDEIIAVGSGITSNKNCNVETTIENRKIKDTNINRFVVDGVEKNGKLSEVVNNAKWAYLEGNTTGSDIGYIFPKGINLNIVRESRTGSWKDINSKKSDDLITKNYATMYIDHGINPNNETYAYAILPNKNEKEVENYSKKPEFEILSNTNKIHAVKENKLGILAANFWTDEEQSVDVVKVNKKSSVMVKETNNTIEISISDPTMENKGYIDVEIDRQASKILQKDSRVKNIDISKNISFRINVKNAKGQTIKVKFEKK